MRGQVRAKTSSTVSGRGSSSRDGSSSVVSGVATARRLRRRGRRPRGGRRRGRRTRPARRRQAMSQRRERCAQCRPERGTAAVTGVVHRDTLAKRARKEPECSAGRPPKEWPATAVGENATRDRRPLLQRRARERGARPYRRVLDGRAHLHARRGRRRLLRRPARPRHRRAAAQGRTCPARRPTDRSWTSAAGTARSRACWPPWRRGPRCTPSTSTPGPASWRSPTRRPSARPTGSTSRRPTRCRRRCGSRRSGPTRRSTSASPPCTSSCRAGCRACVPDGVGWLVVGRNLGGDSLHRWLADSGWDVTRHASQKGFRVLRVTVTRA